MREGREMKINICSKPAAILALFFFSTPGWVNQQIPMGKNFRLKIWISEVVVD